MDLNELWNYPAGVWTRNFLVSNSMVGMEIWLLCYTDDQAQTCVVKFVPLLGGVQKHVSHMAMDQYLYTIFSGMNIHLPAILMFTRGTRFWHTAIWVPPIFNGSTRQMPAERQHLPAVCQVLGIFLGMTAAKSGPKTGASSKSGHVGTLKCLSLRFHQTWLGKP
jgi:hypothetical protein